MEFAVTHLCGLEKVDRIVAMDLSAVEIDLSRVPRDVSRQGIEEAILATAPLKWLHNPMFEEGRAHLETRRLLLGSELRRDEIRNSVNGAIPQIPSMETKGFSFDIWF